MSTRWRLGFFSGLLWALVGCPSQQSEPTSRPTAPAFTLDGGATAPGGRFEFGKVPELVLIRGIPQVVQLGYLQIDPANPWPPGDLERSSGWLSNHPTRLIDAGTNQPVTIFGYEERTGELSYNGTWSGDLTVRIKALVSGEQSVPFRIRVLTPTVVYGANAAATSLQEGWNAKICPSEQTFASCRQTKFTGGSSDVSPLVIYITPGTYSGQDWYLGDRRFTYVVGAPGTRPTLVNDELAGGKKQMFYVANLDLRNVGILHSHALTGAPNTLIVRNVRQCCETRDQNGIMNPNTSTGTYRWEVYWHQSESKGMGGVGNTTHSAYIEGRPNSLFDVNNVRILGSRGSSAIKTITGELNVRHSLLTVAESPADLVNGTCVVGAASTGCLMHTPLDFPGYTLATVYANRVEVWRGPTTGVPVGRSGTLAGTVFVRNRGNSLGSDIPNYPNVTWDPPVSTQPSKVSPCRAWAGTAATFVADQFWKDVRSVPLADHANDCTFKHYVSYNHFVQLPGSLTVFVLRDDGTYPSKAAAQFDVNMIILRNHPLWAERSTSFLYGNTYTGFGATQKKYRLDFEPHIKSIEPLAFWPRQGADDYPRVVDNLGEELPPWFKL